MKYISSLKEGDRIRSVYLCGSRKSAVAKTGKTYESLILKDKTGQIDAKIWRPDDQGIGDFSVHDYVEITGDVSAYMGKLQISVTRAVRAAEGEFDPADYLPVSRNNVDAMYAEFTGYIQKVRDPFLGRLLKDIFIEDERFADDFKKHSAAKSVHHGFVGGLLEHSLSVTKLCEFYTERYDFLNYDLLITAAMCHDIGKVCELSDFPENDYTDEGQLLGHIVMGSEMIAKRIEKIPGFPKKLENELKHCVLAHHGELEFGSPKKPALAEAIALNFADNTDAKLEATREILQNSPAAENSEWLGFNRWLDSNIRRT